MVAKRTHLNRALSKLGVLSRSQANQAILDGRVTVNGRVVREPGAAVDLERATIEVDGDQARQVGWRTLLLNKPRGVLTTRRDPKGRPTVYDQLDARDASLVPVGRLDFATSGLLLLTTDTEFAAWVTDPANQVARTYVVTVRGRVDENTAATLTAGVVDQGERLHASTARVRKASGKESHLIVELSEGRNREVRRMFAALGHEVTRLTRVQFGGLRLGTLAPGASRDCGRAELARAFPGAPIQQ